MFWFLTWLFKKKNFAENVLMWMLWEVELFWTLTHDELLLFVRKFELKNYFEGETVITQWEMGKIIWIVEAGNLDVYQQEDIKKLKLLGHIWAGEIYGEMSYFLGKPAIATVIASKSTICWEITTEDFETVMAGQDLIHDKIMKSMNNRLRSNASK